MKKLAVLALCAVCACSKAPKTGGVVAMVRTDDGAKVTCIEITVTDPKENKVLNQTRFARSNKALVQVGIGQGEFPDDVTVKATGLYSASDCMEPLRPNSTPSEQPVHFTAGKVSSVDFTIRAPPESVDADRDGFAGSAAQGPDCDDGLATVNPGAAEACTLATDNNCNGKVGCDDPACSGMTCVKPAASLAFASTVQSVVSGACSQALVIEAHDDQGMAAPVSASTSVTISEQAPGLGLQFYEDSGCTIAATTRDIAKGMRDVRFYARTTLAGTTRLNAIAVGLTPAGIDHRVIAGPPIALAFKTLAQTVKSDTCSSPVTIEVRDQAGNTSATAAALPLTLTPAPSAGFTLYADATCATPLTALDIGAGMPSATFFFKPVRAPGAVTLTAAASMLTQAVQTETIVPGDPAHVVFVTPARMAVAGVCSQAITVKVTDLQNTDTTAPMTTTLGLNGPTMSFFSSPTCTAASAFTAAPLPAGTGTVTFYFIATSVGSPTLTVSGAGITSATQVETVTPGAPVKLGFTTAAQGLQTTACSGTVRLSTLDANDNPSNVAAPLAITLSATPSTGFTFSPQAACGGGATPTLGLTIPAGQNSVTFTYRGMTAGMVTMLADSSLDPDPTQVTNIGVQAPTQLVYLTPTPQTRIANRCSSAITVEARDPGMNRSNVAADLPIALAASPATNFEFFADNQCTTPVGNITLPAGASQATFYFKGTLAGAVNMTPTSSLTGPGVQVATITPEAATQLVFATPPRASTAGVCSLAIGLQTRDAFGNAAPVAADVTLSLSAVPSGLTFHTDAACGGAATTTVVVPNGTSVATVYARGTLAPSYNLTAQAASVGSATQALSITPAAATKLVVTTSPQTVLTGACSNAFTVERRDAFDNAVNVPAALALNLTAAAGISYFTTAGCGGAAVTTATLPGNASTVSLYFKGNTPGSPAIGATATGITTPASQVQTVNVSPASALAFTTAPQTATAGVPSGAITVETRDGIGNPSPVGANLTVTLSAPPTGFVYCQDPGCAGAPLTDLTIGSGLSSGTFYFKGNTAQTFSIAASAPSFTGATQMETVVPDVASALTFTTGPQSRNAGICSSAVTVRREDMFGNAVTAGGALTVNLGASPGSGFGFYAAGGAMACPGSPIASTTIAAGTATASFFFYGTVPSSVQITASATGLTSASQTEVIGAVAPDRLAFSTSPQTAVAGVCTGPLTVEARDAFANPAAVGSATIVSLTGTAAATTTFYAAADTTCAGPTVSNVTIAMGGTSASFRLRNTAAGSSTLTATGGGLTAANQMLVINAGAAAKLAITSSAQNIGAGSCSAAVAVQTRDTFDNVAPVTAALAVTGEAAPSGGVTFFSDAACLGAVGATVTTVANGTSAGSFYMKGGNTPQAVNVTLSAAGFTGTSQNETVVVGPPNKLVVSSAAKSLMAGECSSAINVQSQDVASNASNVAAATNVALTAAAPGGITFYSDAACATPVTSIPIAAGTNVATFYLIGVTGGSVDITATGAGIPNPGTQTQTIAPAVRSGSCTIANNAVSTPCTISPALNADLTKSFFMFQATVNTSGIDNGSVRCALTNATTLTCSRLGNNNPVTIQWFTVSRPTGLTVQHFPAIVATGTSQTQAISSVTPGSTFLLLSSSCNQVQYGDTKWTTAHLDSATQVTLQRRAGAQCALTHSLQVVDWAGATVDRGSATLADMAVSTTASVTDRGSGNAFVLSTMRWGTASTAREICRLGVRTALTNATTLTFTRAGVATGNCRVEGLALEWEKVTLPSTRVDALSPTIVNGMSAAATLTVAALDLTRTIGFFSGQGMSGQSLGETEDLTVDQATAATARVSFTNATTPAVVREGVGSNGFWSLFVWQVQP